jgi:hypothetical protein
MTENELIQLLEKLRNLMVSVATGGPRIDVVKGDYSRTYEEVAIGLNELGIENPNPYSDLWEWYGRWSGGDLPSYQSRRLFIAEMFNPLIAHLRSRASGLSAGAEQEPTGWPKVDRTIGEIRKRVAEAQNEEQFQAVGLLCREALISLAQSVYDPAKYPTLDGVQAAPTDAKRMFDAFMAVELAGDSLEFARKHARAAFDLANQLQHRRTADFRQAALCAEATASVVNVIAIISGRRDP